jgi:hypothetical protein
VSKAGTSPNIRILAEHLQNNKLARARDRNGWEKKDADDEASECAEVAGTENQ